jgi:hypothetical protein
LPKPQDDNLWFFKSTISLEDFDRLCKNSNKSGGFFHVQAILFDLNSMGGTDDDLVQPCSTPKSTKFHANSWFLNQLGVETSMGQGTWKRWAAALPGRISSLRLTVTGSSKLKASLS